MSGIEQQIEAAWKGYWEANSEWVFSHNKGTFEAGYQAAIASLYVEVDPEDVKHGQIYYASWPGQPVREVYCGDEYFSYWEQGGIGPNGEIEHIEKSINPDLCKVYELNLPSPSSAIGGGE